MCVKINQIDFNLEIEWKSVIIWYSSYSIYFENIKHHGKNISIFSFFLALGFPSQMCCESNDNRSKTVSTVFTFVCQSDLFADQVAVRYHMWFFPLFSPLLCFVSCLLLLACSLSLFSFLYIAVFSIRWFSLLLQSSIATHTHSFSLFRAHTHKYTLSLSVIHSLIHSLILSSFFLSLSLCLVLFSFYYEAIVSLLTLISILSEGSSSILFNHQNDLWDFYTQKYTFKIELIKRNENNCRRNRT